MASEDRSQANSVDYWQRIEQEPWKFGFYRTLRQWECAHADQPRLGTASRPSDESLRIGQEPALTFAPSTLFSFAKGFEDRRRLVVRFLGMFGPHGPLPLHLTEYADERNRHHKDQTFSRFLDLFHHRILSLFYRAWAAAEPTIALDRPTEDDFARFVASLFGNGMEELQGRTAVPDLAKQYFAGHFSNQTNHAAGLESLLKEFFAASTKIEQFVGHWLELPQESRCLLGKSRTTGTLGETAVIGSRIWNCQVKFRVVLGPLAREPYLRLLPGESSFTRMEALVEGYAGKEYIWELQLILKQNFVPPLSLGKQGRLGWTTWLASKPAQEDADDLILSPERVRLLSALSVAEVEEKTSAAAG